MTGQIRQSPRESTRRNCSSEMQREKASRTNEEKGDGWVMVRHVSDENKNTFQVRLNELFAASNPQPTNGAVARAFLDRGCRISAPYLSQLRSGVRTSPSDDVVTALANYFGVSSDHFFTSCWAGDRTLIEKDDAKIVELLCDSAFRELLRAANGLSTTSLELLLNIATKLRASDHGRRVSTDSTSNIRPPTAPTTRRTTSR
ncbi:MULTISPECIES: helix-turn-helix domain-containing protein [unclassified Rhodococcus (in: high G+C Gram-positive bacteria)]|uniref:helix-turn-helix domain-containing protein n=1 Tax=unclassified Rhodococcus (in: high G+C Gram-positive bacteria) TaxID=192944 RepID=UPI0015F500F3|nr:MULTISPECIES: helix-turn-helix transcriptional regulator [unclassified Rhodococcus (in: high G+C Gram-positive bacteria)]